MLELLLCSLLTIFPDYLFRRYGQGKRIGKEITLYSVWFELRWGIVGCLMLTVGLITTSSTTIRRRATPRCSSERCRSFRKPTAGSPRSMSMAQRRGQARRADLPARQLEAGGGREDRAPQVSPRSTRRWWRRGPMSRRPKARSRRPGAPISRPSTNWRRSRS